MKLLKRITQLDNDTIKSNIANNNLDVNTGELSNASHQFHFVYSPVLRIQKAWRTYRDNKLISSKVTPQPDFQSLHFSINSDSKLRYQENIDNNNFEFPCHEMPNDWPGKRNNVNKVQSCISSRLGIESSLDSAGSDRSDCNEPLSNIHVVNEQDLDLNNRYLPCLVQRSRDEDEADFQKRVRKINLLSLAKEFAALKKMNSDALPFDLHQDIYKDASSLSDTASEAEEYLHDSKHKQANRISLMDINNGNNLFPESHHVQSSHSSVPDVVKVVGEVNEKGGRIGAYQAPHGEHTEGYDSGDIITIINEDYQDHVVNENVCVNWNPSMNSDPELRQWTGNREEIRKKLAFYGDDDLDSVENLSGLCFVNEAANDMENVRNKTDIATARPDIIPPMKVHESASQTNDNEDFFTKQARLQTEAKMALAQVRPMAHMQLQLEKQKVTKSPLADIVGMPGYGDGVTRKLARPVMVHMNIAQLQVVVNDLHARIESLNNELMQQLLARDDLHMAQDAMLVDIEDLTGRAQEFAARVNKRRESNKYV